MESLRALVVAYQFPPIGGAGVGRMTKLVKYLPACGVTPTVLTVKNPSVPVMDPALLREVPPSIDIARVRTFEPGYAVKKTAWSAKADATPSARRRLVRFATGVARNVLVPDAQVLWQPHAQAWLWTQMRNQRHDVMLISGPPFSQFLLAPTARLANRNLAVVLDYRDEWVTYSSVYEMMGGFAAHAVAALEERVVRRAHAITTATEAFRSNLLRRFKFLDPGRVHAITNGYDPDDFPTELPSPPKDRFVLTYAGTVFKLTSARGLLGAVRRLHEREPELARLLEVRFIGRIVDTEQDAFEGTEALGVKQVGYVPHEEVIGELAASHEVLCLLDDVPGVDRIYPAKIFELMYLGRPILTLAPQGSLSDLVSTHALGPVLRPRDEDAICNHLVEALRAFKRGEWTPRLNASDTKRFSRREIAREFADVLREAVVVARGRA